jgi:predicted 3-demethylubiquinone-9 3-methyltransferase (glyoxalase superfamily)
MIKITSYANTILVEDDDGSVANVEWGLYNKEWLCFEKSLNGHRMKFRTGTSWYLTVDNVSDIDGLVIDTEEKLNDSLRGLL